MRRMWWVYIVLLVVYMILAAIYGCSGGGGRTPEAQPAAVSLQRLDAPFAQAGQAPDSAARDSLRPGLLALAAINGMRGDSLPRGWVEAYAASPAVRAFVPEVMKAWPDAAVDSLRGALARMLGRDAAEGLTGRAGRRYYTVVSPYAQSVVMVDDTVVLLALNHYLGAAHPAYDGRYAQWQRLRKVPSRVVPDLAEALVATAHPLADTVQGLTLLGAMLHQGAVLEAVRRLTGLTAADILGWTPEQALWMERNEGRAWAALADRDLLFSTDPAVARRMLEPSAGTPALHQQAPGMAGRWVGWRIVTAWLKEHPDAPLRQTLEPGFSLSPATLQEARYAP